MSADPKAVDVLNWIDGVLQSGPRDDYGCAVYDAVAELIDAGRALQEAMDTPEKGPFDSLTVKHFHEADARHRAALARCGDAS